MLNCDVTVGCTDNCSIQRNGGLTCKQRLGWRAEGTLPQVVRCWVGGQNLGWQAKLIFMASRRKNGYNFTDIIILLTKEKLGDGK